MCSTVVIKIYNKRLQNTFKKSSHLNNELKTVSRYFINFTEHMIYWIGLKKNKKKQKHNKNITTKIKKINIISDLSLIKDQYENYNILQIVQQLGELLGRLLMDTGSY